MVRDSQQPASRDESSLSSDDFASIQSFEDATRLINEKLGGVVADVTELGDGFSVLDNKETLIGVPFIALQSVFRVGDYGPYVSMHIVTQDGRKFILNDGGTGIRDQISMLWERKPETKNRPIVCRKGLRKSTYEHPVHGKSTTYYLDTSA